MNMKYKLLLLVALASGLASCGYDNYEGPESMLQGRIVYNGEPINVATNEVTMELWEPGWQLNNRINVAIDQDGSYSAALFNATYKLVFRDNQGPFQMLTNAETNSDTIVVNLNNNLVMDIEVRPYYMIRTPNVTASGKTLTGTANVEKIITDESARDIERVSIYVNKTQFVDGRGNYNIAKTDVPAGSIADLSDVSVSVDLSGVNLSQDYVYARLGVKIQGVEHMIFSPVQKIQL